MLRGLLCGLAWLLLFDRLVEPVPVSRVEVALSFLACPVIAAVLCDIGRRRLSRIWLLYAAPVILGVTLAVTASSSVSPAPWTRLLAVPLSIFASMWIAATALEFSPRVEPVALRAALACFLVFASASLIIVLHSLAPGVSGVNVVWAVSRLALPLSVLGLAIAS